MKSHAKKCVERYCELATGRLNNFIKYLLHALKTTTLKKKKWHLLENCHMYALKRFWNVYTWHVLEDLMFYGQWTNLHDRSQNGPKLVTNDFLVWSLTFITHVNTDNIVTWEILPNNSDWDCFKILTSQEILRIQNLHRVGTLCVFGSPISWMRKKQTCVSHTLTESAIISLDAGSRMNDPRLIFGMWLLM